jgi:hypothetical protein
MSTRNCFKKAVSARAFASVFDATMQHRTHKGVAIVTCNRKSVQTLQYRVKTTGSMMNDKIQVRHKMQQDTKENERIVRKEAYTLQIGTRN